MIDFVEQTFDVDTHVSRVDRKANAQCISGHKAWVLIAKPPAQQWHVAYTALSIPMLEIPFNFIWTCNITVNGNTCIVQFDFLQTNRPIKQINRLTSIGEL